MNFDDLSDSDHESEVPFAQRAARKAFGKKTESKEKDKISNDKWNVRTGNGFGPGFGNIGKGGENMRSDVVQFQKYKMTKDCFLIVTSS